MPGTLTIKPVQADLHCNKDLFKKMDPYCELLIGGQKFKTSVCRRGGKHPHWSDTFNAQVNNETKMHVRMLDKDTFKNDDYIGMCEIDLRNISLNSKEWYPVYCKQNSIGEILLEISYTPQGQPLNQQQFIGQPMPVQQGVQQPQMVFSNPTFCPPEQMQTNCHTAQPIVVFNCPAFSNGSQATTVYPQGQQMGQSMQHVHHPPTHSASIRTFETSDSDIVYAPTLSSLNSIAMSQSQAYSGPRQGYPA